MEDPDRYRLVGMTQEEYVSQILPMLNGPERVVAKQYAYAAMYGGREDMKVYLPMYILPSGWSCLIKTET